MTRVLISDDHPLFRHGLRAAVGTVRNRVVGEATDGRETVRRADELAPDVVLMDLQMPGLNGIEATREILARRPATAVLVLTMFEDDDSVFAAIRAGALGYLVKGAEGRDIIAAVRAAASGQPVFGAALAGRLLRLVRHPAVLRDPPPFRS